MTNQYFSHKASCARCLRVRCFYAFLVHMIYVFYFWLHQKTRCKISKSVMINLFCPWLLKLWEELIQGDCPLSPLSNDALWSQPSPLIARMQMEHSRMHDPCIRWAGFCCVEQKMWTHMSINLSSALVKKLSCAQNKFPCFGVKPVILWAQLPQTWITALFTLCETASSVIEYPTVWYNSLVWGYRKLGWFFFLLYFIFFILFYPYNACFCFFFPQQPISLRWFWNWLNWIQCYNILLYSSIRFIFSF